MPCILAMEQKFKKIKYMCPQACSNQYGRNQCALPASVSVPPIFTISDVQLQACPGAAADLPGRCTRGSGRRCDGAAGSPRSRPRVCVAAGASAHCLGR